MTIKMPEINDIDIPEPDAFGFVKTLNNTGYMTTYLDEFSKAWADACKRSLGLNADIGCAFGIATLEALKDSESTVLAIDLDPSHLFLLRKEAVKLGIAARLITKHGDFPDAFKDLENNSLDNILICRVLHFFDGEKLKQTARWCFNKTKNSGRVFVVSETPYLRNFQSFIPTYEKRRQDGVEFPGFIDDVAAHAPERAQFLPKQMHLLDDTVLSKVFRDAGFDIERSALKAWDEFFARFAVRWSRVRGSDRM